MLISSDQLLHFLKKRRWFAGKARQVSYCAVSQQIPFGDATIWIVEVGYAEGDTEHYQLPVATVTEMPGFSTEQTLIMETEEGYLVDAIYIEDFRKALYTHIYKEECFGEHVSQGPKTAKYLRGRLPLKLVYRKEIGNHSEASNEELRIKRMGVTGKKRLVAGG